MEVVGKRVYELPPANPMSSINLLLLAFSDGNQWKDMLVSIVGIKIQLLQVMFFTWQVYGLFRFILHYMKEQPLNTSLYSHK